MASHSCRQKGIANLGRDVHLGVGPGVASPAPHAGTWAGSARLCITCSAPVRGSVLLRADGTAQEGRWQQEPESECVW